jgi:hypothetical protein
MTTSEERQQVLQMIAEGKITAEEGARLLAALNGAPAPALLPAEPQSMDAPAPGEPADQPQSAYAPEQEVVTPPPPIEAQLPNTRHWWLMVFGISLVVLLTGGLVMAGTMSAGAVCLALFCAVPLLFAGTIGLLVAALAHRGPWVHIRVKHDRPGEPNINFSVPLDLGVVAVRMAEPFVPQMRNTGVDDVIVSLKDNVKRDQPLVIDVHDDEDGEHVQVIVG